MKSFIVLIVFLTGLHAAAQKHRPIYYSAAVTTLHTAYPFGSFGRLFAKEFHPGFELGTGFDWKNAQRHDWFQAFRFGYSYHRFVQHSFALYTEFGYRYKFLRSFDIESRLGAGYLHAITAEKVFVLQNDGTYKKTAGLGRPQAMASFSLGIGRKISLSGTTVFLDYQQRLQFPFIKSYVPLLPSNMLIAGVKIHLKSHPSSSKPKQ